MSKLIRAAQTSQSLSLAAMEEASRRGQRQADIEHLFLALVINDQAAGRALRSMGISLDDARRAVEEEHEAQLTSLGIAASFPEAGRIVFQETEGYEWSRRALDLLTRSGKKNNTGDAAAVLRELLAEPSGLIDEILARLGTSSPAVLEHLDEFDTPAAGTVTTAPRPKGRGSGSTETFIPASAEEVWEFLADPTRIPEWELSVGSLAHTGRAASVGATWDGLAPTGHPDGKPVRRKPRFRRRRIELVTARRPETVAWSFAYPDAPRSRPILTEFTVTDTTGGTQIVITKSWSRPGGWRGLVALPLRPVQRFIVWITLFQTGSAVSRAFR